MNSNSLSHMTIEQLVDRFVAIALEQHEASLKFDTASFNRLFDQMEAVKQQLKARKGDQRRALLPLYEHPNAHVRLKAAKATLAVAPKAARTMLESIANSNEFPPAGDAGMTLFALDQGIFKPT